MSGKRLGRTTCPKCGLVDITDPNRFVIMYPKGVGNANAQATCENCGLVYNIALSYESAVKFDKRGCPVQGFSFARGEAFTDKDIDKWMGNIQERINEFLDGVYEES